MNHPRRFLPFVLLLLAGLPTIADTSFTSTGWLSAVPLPGITVTNQSGQVSLKGNVHVVRIQGDDARVTGRLQAWMDLAYQADGTALFSGPAHSEVGTWDSTGTNFTPSGGVWVLNYSGVGKPDGSSQYNMIGYGTGGNIEGLRLSSTMTRAAPGDAATPYLASGTIQPAPLDRLVISDDFNDNKFTWPAHGVGASYAPTGVFAARETNQQLTIQGTWPALSANLNDMVAWANPTTPAWTLQPGQSIEARVDLVSLSQGATASGLNIYHTGGQAYGLVVARDWVSLGKQYLPGNAWFRVVKATIPPTNLVFSLTITPSGQNVIVSGKVLDKTSGAVVVSISFVDTPASDDTLSSEEVAQLTGHSWQDGRTDPGAPWTNGTAPLLFVIPNVDGTLPQAEATFDNLAMRIYDVPQVGIERAVRLTWPATGTNYTVEAASRVEGPYLPIPDSVPPGFEQRIVPFDEPMKFFRLQQAP